MLDRFIKNEKLEQIMVECRALKFSLNTLIEFEEMDSFYFKQIKESITKHIKELDEMQGLNIIEGYYRHKYKNKLQGIFINAYQEYKEYKRRESEKCSNNLNKVN